MKPDMLDVNKLLQQINLRMFGFYNKMMFFCPGIDPSSSIEKSHYCCKVLMQDIRRRVFHMFAADPSPW